MNTNPQAIRILCYGDSNTHGRDPKVKAEQGIKVRYPADVRWTGQLQVLLGDKFEVIEEGLGGRTTNIDDPDSSGKNGLTYLAPCLSSHTPIDIVILMLGTNDLKKVYNRSAKDIALANKQLIEVIKSQEPNARIILISPPLVDETHDMAVEKYKGATTKANQLAKEFEKVASDIGCSFIDLAQVVSPSQYDGIHLDKVDQKEIAQVLEKEVRNLLKD